MAVDLGCCVACGARGVDLAEHHLNPQSRHGDNPPTVFLCAACHGLVHERGPMGAAALTRGALAEKKRQGKLYGELPFGFDLGADGETLARNAGEQKVLGRIRQERQAGTSLGRIADALNADGVPTKKGKRWFAATVSSVLSVGEVAA